ncbi:MAG: HAD family hydrolase [Oscillospiraceae bacterium]
MKYKSMKIKNILFDLDGTLLPMDQDIFVKAYLALLTRKMEPLGYNAKALVSAIWEGTAAMVQNDGSFTNEEVFWRCFEKRFGDRARGDILVFEDFYKNEFQAVRQVCGNNPEAPHLINWLREEGYSVVLATNPVFPAIATISRMRWAGLEPEQFTMYTTYENTSYCKPNIEYYKYIVSSLGCRPEECLMVGNDVEEDMAAEKLGMKVFLLTDCMINRDNRDINCYPNGSFSELRSFIENERGEGSELSVSYND